MMAAVSFTVLRSRHSSAGISEILRAEFRQTNQFITVRVTRIMAHEKADMRISTPPCGHKFQFTLQSLRVFKTHNPRLGIKLFPKALHSEMVAQSSELVCHRYIIA